MKKLIYTAFVICGMLTASCSDLLNLESKTDVTNNYLFTTPEVPLEEQETSYLADSASIFSLAKTFSFIIPNLDSFRKYTI